ncbi:MAG: DeoR/GlpR family DNA-binding transcription regulator [Bacillota bacterium]|nr:DeoR/GlpR family DNA-binding transcription regulator [Bacillota bacterium]
MTSYDKRKEIILSTLNDQGRINVEQLCRITGNSAATLRRDIIRLEEEGLIRRFWGGIQRMPQEGEERQSHLKNRVSTVSQDDIGKLAAAQISDKDLIFIGSGTTTLAMIPYIRSIGIQVVTNGIPQLEALYEKGIPTLLLGGFFKSYSRSLVGMETVEMLNKYQFDKAFLGANGLDSQLNILSGDDYENAIKSITIKQSKRTYLLVDRSKFGRTALYNVPFETAKDVILISDYSFMDSHTEESDGAVIDMKSLSRIKMEML